MNRKSSIVLRAETLRGLCSFATLRKEDLNAEIAEAESDEQWAVSCELQAVRVL